ncbi:MAG: gliding motility-associated C-terminal domain-containing protein [Flavobacteriales bacterium]|nr:gliding motility-associated C-terminal domain-containing protein [Flavobacteriales bacterium]
MILMLITLVVFNVFSQKYYQESPITFIENKGQWQDNILFRADIPGGTLFLERDKLTYVFSHPDDITYIHEMHHGFAPEQDEFPVRCHAYNVTFLGSQIPKTNGIGKTPDYNNYYLGNDSTKWAAKCEKFYAVEYESIYPGIDFRIYTNENGLKYDFIVHPGANPNDINLFYEGLDRINLVNKDLILSTSINNVVEKKPISFQGEKQIKSSYELEGNNMKFKISEYDTSKDLIIDPALVFSTYSGSTADNWGYTATFDEAGHLYSAGVAFANGYPITTGAFQTTWGGSGSLISDIVVSKFSTNGTSLVYSTYVGGNKSECPHSLIVDGNDNLIIFGTTSSGNYPTTSSAYNTSFNGGTNVSASGINYSSGSDLIITKLNSTGTALVGSTFVGGSGNDGLNTGSASSLDYNYADYFRGEVIVDASNNIIVATCTKSADFPIAGGGQQSTFGGAQDGIVFKLNSNLTTMQWSTYLGGTDFDAAYGMQLNDAGDLYVVGGTQSSDFPTTGGVFNSNSIGGVDGFIVKLNSSGSSILASSYIGTTSYDQTYFVQLDANQDVYILGQTEGAYLVSPATVYSNPNSGQFVHKMDPNLSSTIFSTVIGRGSGEVDIALTAFLVNECNHIYISGWGGTTNQTNGSASASTTIGLPITADAFQSSTDGSDFYLMVLDADAVGLVYGSFFGGSTSAEHVDGGTSRFDKDGIVYQAVCGGCGGNSDFPTTAGAWSNTNNSSNCNIASFKFDLSSFSAIADVSFDYLCTGTGTQFINNSTGGTSYVWYFGDGTTSAVSSPTHTYQDTGVYEVMLIVNDPASCIVSDTSFLSVTVTDTPDLESTPADTICPGGTVTLNVSGATTYSWIPTMGLSDPTSANPDALVTDFIEYTVTGSTFCGTTDIIIPVNVFQDPVILSEDTSMCRGETIVLYAYGGENYSWTPTSSIDFPDSNIISVSSQDSITYFLEVIDAENCLWNKTITIEVDTNLPKAYISNDTIICLGSSVSLVAGGGTYYEWSPTTYLDSSQISTPVTTPFSDIKYVVSVINGCGEDWDTVKVKVNILRAAITPDTLACQGDSIQLRARGGVNYIWGPKEGLSNSNINNPKVLVEGPIAYQVVIFDSLNCSTVRTISLDTFPEPAFDAGENFTIEWSKSGQLAPEGEGISFIWSPSDLTNCDTCFNPEVNPSETTVFSVTMTDEYGCVVIDSVTVYVTGSIYIPNTFTPNGDRINDYFLAYGKEIKTFEMFVYNRWGNLIFKSDDITIGWNGTFKGKKSPIGTYVWKIVWQEYSGEEGEAIGHVNLLR